LRLAPAASSNKPAIASSRTVRPKSLPALQSRRQLLSPPRSAEPVPAEDRQVRAGYLARPGVNPVDEMVELITASRAYEAMSASSSNDTATSG
jgi:flagellar basal body rod protein FlgC